MIAALGESRGRWGRLEPTVLALEQDWRLKPPHKQHGGAPSRAALGCS